MEFGLIPQSEKILNVSELLLSASDTAFEVLELVPTSELAIAFFTSAFERTFSKKQRTFALGSLPNDDEVPACFITRSTKLKHFPFVITPDGSVSRFRPTTQPDAPEVIAAIESGLAQEVAA